MNAQPTTYTDAVRSDSDLIAAAVEGGPLDAAVTTCPGWDLRELVVHTGMVHRWATRVLLDGKAPDDRDLTLPGDDENLAAWMRAGAGELADRLDALGPDADVWHPWSLDRKAWVWYRRLANETMVHRWDAEVAVAGSSSLEPARASDGVDEYFELGLPRVLEREQILAPDFSLHVHCTDVEGEWLIWGEGGELQLLAEHRKGDAALRGPAEMLLLVLMGRADRDRLDVVGDPAAAAEWLDLPGW
ncbi:MAG: maleylpyruvate isomerase family mycothiol-dependent enzyme [Ilumatobacteraceae bacterium]